MKIKPVRAKVKHAATKRRNARVVREIDRGLGHAAFALVQCLLDDLVTTGKIPRQRASMIIERARSRLIEVPSHRAALNLLEVAHADREKSMARSH
jgi:hypothetical protein